MSAESILGIQRLIAEYCRALDEGRTDDLVNLFAVDAVVVAGGERFSGRADIRAGLGERPPDLPQGQHVTANFIIDVEGLGVNATARSDFFYLSQVENGLAVTTAGRYYDRLVREMEGWRFTARTITFLGEPAPSDW